MEKKISKEVKIGIAFVFALFILYFGISFLKGVNIFKPSNSYQVAFDDVTDLTVSTPVILNGLQVGLVNSMHLDDSNKKVIVNINLNKGMKIPVGSELKIDGGMLGGAKVILIPDNTQTQYYTSDDIIPGKRATGMMESVSGLVPGVGNLLPKIDSILTGIQVLVANPALTSSLENVNGITADLKVSTQQLNQLMTVLNKDVPKITSNFANVSEDLSNKVNSIDLVGSFKSIDNTLKNIQTMTDKLNSKDNSVGLLLNDRQLYDSINSTLNNASLLLKDVKENPSRYINVKVF